MSRPKREQPSLPRPYAKILAEAEKTRRADGEPAPEAGPDPDQTFEQAVSGAAGSR